MHAEVRLAAVHEIVRADGRRLGPGSDGDEPPAVPEERATEVERALLPDKIDDHICSGVPRKSEDRLRASGRIHGVVRADVEGRLAGFLPRVDREDLRLLDLRDLDGGQADAPGADD